MHKAKIIQKRIPYWQKMGGIYTAFASYSPESNLSEIVWRKMKGDWINPEKYLEKDALFYVVNRFLTNLGQNVTINFWDFNLN